MSAKYIPLKEVAAQVLNANGKSIGSMFKVMQLCYRAMEALHFNVSAEPSSVLLPVDGNLTVPFPPDYVQWVKIGLLTADGKVSTLKVNNSLTTFRDNNPNRLTNIVGEIGGNWLSPNGIYLNYFNGLGYVPLFGIGGGIVTYGDCRVDEKNNVIIFPPDFRYSNILLEYISCPQDNQGYEIDRRLREPIIAFCEWKLKLAPEKSFYDRAKEARREMFPISLQEVNQVLRENTKFCLKY